MRRDDPDKTPNSRRAFLRSGALGVTATALAMTGVRAASAAPQLASPKPGDAPLAVTPSCSGAEIPAEIEGPLFKPDSPERANFVTPAIRGVYYDLRGVVYDTACTPIAGALLEFWSCDQNGDYDTAGFSLRGHQFTNEKGEFHLQTIVPRDYYGRWGRRAPHIHTKAQAPGGPLLTTQLYFPDDTQAYGRDFAAINAGDGLFNRSLVMTLGAPAGNHYDGRFDFVIKTTVDTPAT